LNQIEKLQLSVFDQNLDKQAQQQIHEIFFLDEVNSTNDYLLDMPAPDNDKAIICMAEHQFSGKGTKGRIWQSGPGTALIYSIAWTFKLQPGDLSALSLAIGVVAQQTLEQLNFPDIRLKWPNDLLVGNAKLGGILVETRPASDCTQVVAGIGINIKPLVNAESVDCEIISLEQINNSASCSPNILGALLTNGLIDLFSNYPESKFNKWINAWHKLHAFQNKHVNIVKPDRSYQGLALGVDENGALLLETKNGLEKILSAEIQPLVNIKT